MLKFAVYDAKLTEKIGKIWKKGKEFLILQNVNTSAHFLTHG